MRFISLLVAFCFSFNVLASHAPASELELALDNFHYALTVEWDQKDAAFMQSKTEEFYATLATLMNQGLSPVEVMDVVAKKVKDPKQLEAIKFKMNLLSQNANSATELANLLNENSKELYATGASWEGYIYMSVGLGIVIAAAIAYSIWWDTKHVCVETAQGQQCGWVSYYQGGPQYYQCWQTTYCTRYEER